MQLLHQMNILCAALATVPLVSAASGSFKVLSYNVAGLLEPLSSSNPSENTPYISERLGAYDIINVQEDFNYHAALYASDTHAYRTATSGGAGIGSGLNTLSDMEFIDFERTTWDDCYLNSGDCLTPKGFTAMRVRLSSTQWVDVYNLHTDAGSESGDQTARGKNIQQLLDYMAVFSPGMPVMVWGDTNSRYTTSADHIRLMTDAGFTDSWVLNWRNGTPPDADDTALTCTFPFASGLTQAEMCSCEVVDKIFFRNTDTALGSLESLDFTNEDYTFLHPTTGEPLSDHYPIASTFSWSEDGNSLRLSDVVGGPHGDYYNDVPTLLAAGSTTPKITTLTLSGGSRLDRIEAAYDSISTITHGGTGGDAVSLTLASGETIVEVSACSGQKDGHTRVFYMNVTTSAGNTLEAGTSTDACSTLSAPESGKRVVGFWGRSGDEVDRMGVVWG